GEMDDETGGPADEEPLLPRQAPRHPERVAVGNGAHLVDDVEPERRRDLVVPDPLDLVRPPLAHLPGAVVLGENGAVRVPRDHADGRVLLLQVLPRPADRAAGAGRGNDVRDPPLRLLPDLRARGAVV